MDTLMMAAHATHLARLPETAVLLSACADIAALEPLDDRDRAAAALARAHGLDPVDLARAVDALHALPLHYQTSPQAMAALAVGRNLRTEAGVRGYLALLVLAPSVTDALDWVTHPPTPQTVRFLHGLRGVNPALTEYLLDPNPAPDLTTPLTLP